MASRWQSYQPHLRLHQHDGWGKKDPFVMLNTVRGLCCKRPTKELR